jgi:hypothetical protein
MCGLILLGDCERYKNPQDEKYSINKYEQCKNSQVAICYLEFKSKEKCSNKSDIPLTGGISP